MLQKSRREQQKTLSTSPYLQLFSPTHSKGLIIIFISQLPLQSSPIDSCPLIYKSLIEKEAADIFTSFYKKKEKIWQYADDIILFLIHAYPD